MPAIKAIRKKAGGVVRAMIGAALAFIRCKACCDFTPCTLRCNEGEAKAYIRVTLSGATLGYAPYNGVYILTAGELLPGTLTCLWRSPTVSFPGDACGLNQFRIQADWLSQTAGQPGCPGTTPPDPGCYNIRITAGCIPFTFGSRQIWNANGIPVLVPGAQDCLEIEGVAATLEPGINGMGPSSIVWSWESEP